MTLRIVEIPCLRDNYAYLVHLEGRRETVIIDPSEAKPVAQTISDLDLELVAILNTHHHWDHIGGNEALLAQHPDLAVYAHRSDHEKNRVPGQTHDVDEGVAFNAAGLTFDVLHIPGHTMGAVAYIVDDAVFTGDTLFVAGCGRLFEGTAAMMNDSLNGKLAKLPPDTRVFCGHEYTVNNLKFALTVEPDNSAIRNKLRWAEERRAANQATVPSTIAEELTFNPFMRVSQAAVADKYDCSDPVDVMAAVRSAKDSF